MTKEGSMNKLDFNKHLVSRSSISNWMCVQHNIIKIDRLTKNFEEMSIEEQQKIYSEYEKEDKIFVCTEENLKRRWGPLG